MATSFAHKLGGNPFCFTNFFSFPLGDDRFEEYSNNAAIFGYIDKVSFQS